jgi:hypothetical protein
MLERRTQRLSMSSQSVVLRFDAVRAWRNGSHGVCLFGTALVAFTTLLSGCAGGSDKAQTRSSVALVTSALDEYVAAQARVAAESAAAAKVGQSSPFVSVHSGPVKDGAATVAVAAFSYSATGHPVQILSYATGRWSTVARLGPDVGPPVQPSADVFYLAPGAPVSVADLTGDGRPDFLIMVQAADNTPGIIVSQDGGTWRYIPNSGPFPTSYILARNPQFRGRKLISDYDNCVPDCATGHNFKIVWSYKRSSGDFWAPNPPGWTAPPGAVNSQ